MKQIGEHILIAGIGGLVYVGIEFLWRGHSHWTMFVLGGICFVSIGLLDELWPAMPLLVQMVCGALLVTAAELVLGLLVNVWLGWGVWDYTGLPGSLFGQISLPYTALWFLLTGAAACVEDLLHAGLRRLRRKPSGHA